MYENGSSDRAGNSECHPAVAKTLHGRAPPHAAQRYGQPFESHASLTAVGTEITPQQSQCDATR